MIQNLMWYKSHTFPQWKQEKKRWNEVSILFIFLFVCKVEFVSSAKLKNMFIFIFNWLYRSTKAYKQHLFNAWLIHFVCMFFFIPFGFWIECNMFVHSFYLAMRLPIYQKKTLTYLVTVVAIFFFFRCLLYDSLRFKYFSTNVFFSEHD